MKTALVLAAIAGALSENDNHYLKTPTHSIDYGSIHLDARKTHYNYQELECDACTQLEVDYFSKGIPLGTKKAQTDFLEEFINSAYTSSIEEYALFLKNQIYHQNHLDHKSHNEDVESSENEKKRLKAIGVNLNQQYEYFIKKHELTDEKDITKLTSDLPDHFHRVEIFHNGSLILR